MMKSILHFFLAFALMAVASSCQTASEKVAEIRTIRNQASDLENHRWQAALYKMSGKKQMDVSGEQWIYSFSGGVGKFHTSQNAEDKMFVYSIEDGQITLEATHSVNLPEGSYFFEVNAAGLLVLHYQNPVPEGDFPDMVFTSSE